MVTARCWRLPGGGHLPGGRPKQQRQEAIGGLRLVVVDDSIVRGNTTKAIVAMLREAGARQVHVRITSPPVRWPCLYGIDMATRAELVASDLCTDEVASYLGA